MESWRPVSGFEGYYEVSSEGRVRSLERRVFVTPSRQSANGYWRAVRERVLKPSLSVGYNAYVLWKEHQSIQSRGSVLVARAFHGPRPEGTYVCHRDGNRTNDAAANLYYGTPSENVADARRHGTLCIGERAGASKLLATEVLAIRESNQTQQVIASRYGLSQAQVSRIRHRRQWSHLS